MLYLFTILIGVVSGVLFSFNRQGLKIGGVLYGLLLVITGFLTMIASNEGFQRLGYFILLMLICLAFIFFLAAYAFMRVVIKKNP